MLLPAPTTTSRGFLLRAPGIIDAVVGLVVVVVSLVKVERPPTLGWTVEEGDKKHDGCPRWRVGLGLVLLLPPAPRKADAIVLLLAGSNMDDAEEEEDKEAMAMVVIMQDSSMRRRDHRREDEEGERPLISFSSYNYCPPSCGATRRQRTEMRGESRARLCYVYIKMGKVSKGMG